MSSALYVLRVLSQTVLTQSPVENLLISCHMPIIDICPPHRTGLPPVVVGVVPLIRWGPGQHAGNLAGLIAVVEREQILCDQLGALFDRIWCALVECQNDEKIVSLGVKG